MSQSNNKAQPGDLAAKTVAVTDVIKNIVNEAKDKIISNDVTLSTEALIKMETIISRLDTIEKLLAGDKRPIKVAAGENVEKPKKTKKSASTTTSTTSTTTNDKFPVSILIYWKQHFNDVDFKEKYINKKLLEDADKLSAESTKSESAKRANYSTVCWGLFKNNKELYALLENEYKSKKSNFENTNTHIVQETVEANSPPATD